MALLLHLRRHRTKPYTLSNPSLFFSTSGESNPKSPFDSFFRDLKDGFNPRSSNSHQSSLHEIQKNLSSFRDKTSLPPPSAAPPPPTPPQEQISFQEIYNRNMPRKPATGFDSIRESLKNIRKGGDGTAFRNALNLKSSDSRESGGGTSALPDFFGKETATMTERKVGGGMKMQFLRTYGDEELGEKLRLLRPERKEKDWFSIAELNERLVRLREMEEKQASSVNVGGSDISTTLRDCLKQIDEKEDKSKKFSLQRLNMLGQLGATPSFSLGPPKEHLVEKYYHPDNMSSAEKLKIELTKVRDEFKMSESDCGSARVQVAQLTTKIKHLSAALHKKDVHSRKGLLAMVQKRKRLLKYLRRTDWDSYCFVISKLGLRDNPDHSHKIRTSRSGLAAS
ncbi:hypothetical protein RJT34_25810 [Clitoria ternatea]|uniref:Small ribosomal subunit protein uS15c n=1 Tax=Clitoria ternatea TaxID=43366 RepID=A0AAN9FYD7_CLITE